MPVLHAFQSSLAQVVTNTNNGGGFAIVGVVPCFLALVIFALFLWALIDCIGNTRLQGNMKLIWILVIIFTSPIGPILYLLIGRKA